MEKRRYCDKCGLPHYRSILNEFQNGENYSNHENVFACDGIFNFKFFWDKGIDHKNKPNFKYFVCRNPQGNIKRCGHDSKLQIENFRHEQMQKIPEMYWHARIDSFKTSINKTYAIMVQELVKAFENEDNRIIFICGFNRTGKTHLACGLAQMAIESGKTIGFMNCREIEALAKQDEKYSDQVSNRVIQEYKENNVIFFDDMGADLSGKAGWILYDIIESNAKKIVITANFTSDLKNNYCLNWNSLQERYKDNLCSKLASRIQSGHWCELKGSPYKEG